MRGYYMFPDIYGDDIIFVTEDDLWKFSGGVGVRLTSDFGVVVKPKFSPDGRWIAFTRLQQTDQGTTADVYVIPAGGGEPRRITYFGTPFTRAVGWTPDGRVLVHSDFKTPFPQWRELYAVSLTGVYERLNLGPATALVYGDGGVVILGRNNYDLPYWKRYRGGTRGVLWISRDGGRTFQKFLELPGNITSPMLAGGRVYFISDHEGVGNLYSVDLNGGDLRRHTDFRDFYVRNASTDGRRIVFQAGGDIYIYDPATGRVSLVDIDLHLSRKAKMAKFVDPVKHLEHFSPASGTNLVVVSRGQAFSVPAWEGAVVQLGVYAASTGAREVALLLLAVSGLVHTLFNKPRALCGRVRWGGCEVVLASPYARPFGIPLEWLGAAWFAGVLPLYYLGFGQMWGFLALLTVAVLVGIEIKLRAMCIYCTVAHVIGVITAVLLLGL